MAISTPSMRIRPPALSRIRNKAKANEDLPAPVRPTMPICREENNRSTANKRAYDQNIILTTLRRDIQCEKFIEDASVSHQLQCILISYYLFLYLPNKFTDLWFQE